MFCLGSELKLIQKRGQQFSMSLFVLVQARKVNIHDDSLKKHNIYAYFAQFLSILARNFGACFVVSTAACSCLRIRRTLTGDLR